ncbi:Os01g0543400, partial [Oryza sativa Japonica Group]
ARTWCCAVGAPGGGEGHGGRRRRRRPGGRRHRVLRSTNIYTRPTSAPSAATSSHERCQSTRIILITPPPIYEMNPREFGRYMEKMTLQNYRNVPAGTNAQACLAVAKELNYPVIDIWTKMQQFPD